MAFQKGKTKTGGRKPGSTNIIGKDLRGRVLDIVENNLEGLEGTLEHLEPKDRIAVILKLMEFVLPKGVQANPPVQTSAQMSRVSDEAIDLMIKLADENYFERIPLENRIAALALLEPASP